MEPEKDLYKVLGVSRKATPREIRTAFQQASLKYHPDKSSDHRAEEKMKEINVANEVLRSPRRRNFYDRTGSTSNMEREYGSARSAPESQPSIDTGGYCGSCGRSHPGDCGGFNFKPADSGPKHRECCACDHPETNQEHFVLPCGCCFWCFDCACISFQDKHKIVDVLCKCGVCHDIKLEQVKEFIPARLYEECQHFVRPACDYCGNETNLLKMSWCKHIWCIRCTINRFNRATRSPDCCGHEFYESFKQYLPRPVATLYSLKKDARFINWESPSMWAREKAAVRLWEQQNSSIVFGPEAAALLSAKDRQIKELQDKLAKKDDSSESAATKARTSELEAETQKLRSQVTQTQPDLEKAQAALADVSRREVTAKEQTQDLYEQLAEANRKASSAQTSASDTKHNQDSKPSQKECTDHIEALKAKDAEIKRLAQEQKLALDGEQSAKMAQNKAEEETKRLQERYDPGNISKLGGGNHDLRAQLSQSQKEVLACAQSISDSQDQIDALTEQLANAKNNLSLAQDTAAKATADRIIGLEVENLDLRTRVEKMQAEHGIARDAHALAIQSAEARAQVQRLESQLAELKKEASATLAASNTRARSVSFNLQTELRALKDQVTHLRAELSTARQAEQAAVESEAAARDEAERFRDQLAEAQKPKGTSTTPRPTEQFDPALDTSATKALADTEKLRVDTEVAMNVLRGQLEEAKSAQKSAEDEVTRLRTQIDKGNTDSRATSSGTTTEESTTEAAANDIKSAPSDSKSESSLWLLRGQLMLAEKYTRSAQDEKAMSIAETIRLRGELDRYKRFELEVAQVVENGRQDFGALQAELRETKKQLRKYTGNVKELKESADSKAGRSSKTKTSHLHIQTTQLATLREKDREIERLKVRAGIAQCKLTSTIIARNDEIKNLKATLNTANHAGNAPINQIASLASPTKPVSKSTALTHTDPLSTPYSYHKMSKEAQALLDAEIAQSRQVYEQTCTQRANAFRQFQLEQKPLPNRHKYWEALEEETYQDQQTLRRDLQLEKEALIRRTRLAEDWLTAGLAKREEAEAQHVDRREILAEAREGKQKMQVTVEDFDDI